MILQLNPKTTGVTIIGKAKMVIASFLNLKFLLRRKARVKPKIDWAIIPAIINTEVFLKAFQNLKSLKTNPKL